VTGEGLINELSILLADLAEGIFGVDSQYDHTRAAALIATITTD